MCGMFSISASQVPAPEAGAGNAMQACSVPAGEFKYLTFLEILEIQKINNITGLLF